jgi:hypothetical protein
MTASGCLEFAWSGGLRSEGQRLLTAPYEDRDTFVLNVMLVRGVLYLEAHHTDAQLLSKCVLLSTSPQNN